MEPQAPRKSASRTAVVSLATAAIAAVAGFAAIYVTVGGVDNASDDAPPAIQASDKAAAPAASGPQDTAKGAGSNDLSRGKMAAFVLHEEPRALPEIRFQDGTGKELTLADWRGKVVLLNLWATWCIPCREEMPALDRLQKALGSEKFEVVALSVDRKGVEASKKFLGDAKIENLALYVQPKGRATSALRVVGLPATILIDAEGREIGRLLGPAEWDGEDAQRLIRTVLEGQ